MIAANFLSLVFLLSLWSGIQLYAARILIAKRTPFGILTLFSFCQGLCLAILNVIVPFLGIRFLLCTIFNLLMQRWLLEKSTFPNALFGAIAPLLFAFSGEIIFPPLFIKLFGINSSWATIWGIVPKPYLWTAVFPIILIALYIKLRNYFLVDEGDKSPFCEDLIRQLSFFLPIIILHKLLLIVFLNYGVVHLYFGRQFFYSSFVILPVIFATLLKNMRDLEYQQRIIEYQAQTNKLQKSALWALREERHDFLNELTLISTYLELGKINEAQSCIDYAAASLSERYNYMTLPGDAWLTVLNFKEKEAKQRGICFTVQIKAEQPEDFNECRLLPKLIFNLVDNAFDAASQAPDPQVTLVWKVNVDGKRILEISNNGPVIPSTLGSKIFIGGVSSKTNFGQERGWGLVICKKIAAELGGSLTFSSTSQKTTFSLRLPPAQAPQRTAVSLAT